MYYNYFTKNYNNCKRGSASMADILKISTPYIDKSAIPAAKPVSGITSAFSISDNTRAIATHTQNQLQSNTNALLLGQNSPSMLASLLRDPAVAVNFLKNVYMLQEFIQLIPVHNSALTAELQKAYDGLMISPEEITQELIHQEETATSYKGELFDFLRETLQQNPQKGFANAVAMFLKSLNGTLDKHDITQSLSNNLKYLASTLEGSKELSDQLKQLAAAFDEDGGGVNFSRLKADTLELLSQIEQSILYSPKQQRTIPLVIHNLSRFNDNAEFLQDTVSLLLSMMGTTKERDEFMRLLKDQRTIPLVIHNLSRFNDNAEFLQDTVSLLLSMMGTTKERDEFMRLLKDHIASSFASKGKEISKSKVVDALSELLQRQSSASGLSAASHEKMEKILHSLLSSPSNFTPLLHFIVPVQDGMANAFGEIWIDPNADTPPPDGELGEDNIHMLIEFDVETIGQLEVELFVNDDRLSIIMLCPDTHIDIFSKFSENIKTALEKTDYTLGTVKVDKLEEPRSLMQVFKSLPHRRTGINLKI